jgi:alanine racemase
MIGMYTHFSVADTDFEFTKMQFDIFKKIIKFAKINLNLKFVAHCANSNALIKYKEFQLDMVRPGLIFYGLKPFKDSSKFLKLKPILSWKTKIVFLKKVPANYSISYGRTYITNNITHVAVIPIGYADGFNRLLSNQGNVLVHGKRCRIIGRVTMDMTMLDVSEIKNISLGDEVTIIGQQESQEISADELAKFQNTINYEITCSISSRVPKIII